MTRSAFQIPSLLTALDEVLSPGGFPYASNWHLFRDAEFGRDSLEVAEDLLHRYPALARTVITRLAELQGTTTEERTEEEPGRIHHEYRARVMEGRPIAGDSLAIFRLLSQHWHGYTSEEQLEPLDHFICYATVDATPLYVRLVARYCQHNGREILSYPYVPIRSPETAPAPTIAESIHHAVEWISRRIASSPLGLLEFGRTGPQSIRFQSWKDGATSYLHVDGRYCNFSAPIASIEVQGLAYDALRAAPILLPQAPEDDRQRWAAQAEHLQRATFDLFWMPEECYFAMAIDRDPSSGAPRQVRLRSSNPGALLDSTIFDTLDPHRREKYVSAIVEHLFHQDFLTEAGIRCTSLIHQQVLDYAAYQSSHTIWHKETYDIAKGLRRQGLGRLAVTLEHRLLNAVNIAGPVEFLYVLPDNQVAYLVEDSELHADGREIAGTNIAENNQAWSISAALAIKQRHGARTTPPTSRSMPYRALEDQIIQQIPPTQLLRSIQEIQQARRQQPVFRINKQKGMERERAYIRQQEKG